MLSPVSLSVRPSACLFVTRVDHTKTVEIRIMKFSPIPLVFQVQVLSRNSEGGVGKIGDLRTLSRPVSETVQDMTKVAIDH